MENIRVLESSASLKQKALDSLRDIWGEVILAIAIYYAIVTVPSSIISMILGEINIIGGIYSLLIAGPASFGLVVYCLNIYRKKEYNISDVFSGFGNFGRSFLMNLWKGLWLTLWSLLVLIPGVILVGIVAGTGLIQYKDIITADLTTEQVVGDFAGYLGGAVLVLFAVIITLLVILAIIYLRYSMAYYILVDNPNMGVAEALKTSIMLMKNNKGKLFYIYLSFIGWGILTSIAVGIISFILGMIFGSFSTIIVAIVTCFATAPIIAYMTITETAFYNVLSGNEEGDTYKIDEY